MMRTTVNVLSGRHRRVRRMRPLGSDSTRDRSARNWSRALRLARDLKGAARG